MYTDADWAGCVIDQKSTTGYCSFVWGFLVTWRSKKQSVVARRSAEAEYRAMTHGIYEGIWLKRMLEELQIPTSYTIRMLCDAKLPSAMQRTQFIMIEQNMSKLTDIS